MTSRKYQRKDNSYVLKIAEDNNKRNASIGRMRRGPIVVKILCGICVAQIIFTVYVAVKVLNATLQPDSYIFGGGPAGM